MPEIDILMAVRNGEKYIAEQIDSILNQTFQDFRLIIRDNSSTDNTPAIIEEYVKKYPGKVQAVHDDVDCTASFTKNFMQLLTYAEADYVMFTDSDDYWLPYKIQVSLWHMKELERKNPGLPALVFSGLQVVDENLQSMDICSQYITGVPEYRNFTNLLLSNVVSGCTSILNRALYSKSKGYIEDMPFAHDSFFGAMASGCGVLEHIPAAMILYRQHGHNASGYIGASGKHGVIMSWLVKVLEFRTYAVNVRKKCKFMLEHYSDVLLPERRENLEKFVALLDKPKIAKFFMLLFGKWYKLEGRLYCKIKYFFRVVLC